MEERFLLLQSDLGSTLIRMFKGHIREFVCLKCFAHDATGRAPHFETQNFGLSLQLLVRGIR